MEQRQPHDGSTNEPNANKNEVARQILHLARPLLDTLPNGDDR
jgi:hypothetical protein